LKKPIPVLACHQHFLSDIGKDLLEAGHHQLRDGFRQIRLSPARLRPPAGQPSGRIDRYGARGSRSLAGRKRPHSCPSERRSEEHTSELQSRGHLVCRLLLEKKKTKLNQK